MFVSKDVKFFELDSCSWENDKKVEFQKENEDEYEEDANNKKWIVAMKKEFKMIENNQTQELMDKPKHKIAIGVKWVYKTKQNLDRSVNKYKARLIVKGYV